MAISLRQLAEHIGADLRGDGDLLVSGVSTLDAAGRSDITFLVNRRYRKFLAITAAAAVIMSERDAEDCPVAVLISSNPHLAYARAAALLYQEPTGIPTIHPSAVVDEQARVHPSASIGANAVIEAGARIGASSSIGPGVVIGRDTRIGEFTRILANVSIGDKVVIGRRVLIHPGAVIGADGFGLAKDGERWVKVPQVGSVHIGDDVEIGANTTIDRGAVKDTIIEEGVKLDNLIQIAHNVVIGAHTAIAGCTGIAGSSRIGKRCMIGGGVGISGHLEITDDVTVTATSLVSKSITRPGIYSASLPARPVREWNRRLAKLNKLDD